MKRIIALVLACTILLFAASVEAFAVLAEDSSPTETTQPIQETQSTDSENSLKDWYSSDLETQVIEQEISNPSKLAEDILASGSCGENLTWSLSSSGTLIISGEGAIPDYVPAWSSIREQITRVVMGDGVISIGTRAFMNCSSLSSVVMSNRITEIGQYAFCNCSSLRDIVIPDGVKFIGEYAFSNCTNLSSISLPEGMLEIGTYVFADCSSLATVTIGYGLTKISSFAFARCEKLSSIKLADSVTTIGMYAFEDCVSLKNIIIPDSVTAIGNSVFAGCTQLGKIVIPESVNTIGASVFNNCLALSSITFCGDAPEIDSSAFRRVTASALYPVNNKTWTSAVMGSYGGSITWNSYTPCTHEYIVDTTVLPTCTKIGYTTYNCSLCGKTRADYTDPLGHSYVNGVCEMCGDIPYTVVSGSCGDAANWALFSDGTFIISGSGPMTDYAHSSLAPYGAIPTPWKDHRGSINNVVVKEGITSIGGDSFNDCPILCNVVIPSTVTNIGERAFYKCTSLTGIVLPETITGIEKEAFSYCSSLTSVEIPDGVTALNGTFSYCSHLESVRLPNNLKEMDETFLGCSSLISVEIPDGVTSLDHTFGSCSSLESVKLPKNLMEIEEKTFHRCSSLLTVDIPDGVVLIGASAFAGSKVETVSIPNSVKVIGESAFVSCDNLRNIVIPYGVQSIWRNAFQDCSNLQSVSLPVTVESIETYAFLRCKALTDVYYTGSEEQWSNVLQYTNDLDHVTIHYLGTEPYVDTDIEHETLTTKGGQPNYTDRFVLPPSGQKFYNWLEESTDGDGEDDELIVDGADTYTYSYMDKFTIQAGSAEELIVKLAREGHALAHTLKVAYETFRLDQPISWFLPVYSISRGINRLSETTAIIEMRVKVYFSAIEKDKYYELVALKERTITDIISVIPEDATTFEKVRYFNAYLTRNNGYNSDYPNEPSSAHDAITALVGNSGTGGPVCDAYARAFKILCETQNIPCALVFGKANGGSHAWNLVQMEDGNWYAVDVTWNDPIIPDVSAPVSGHEREDYLLVGSETNIGNKSFDRSHIETLQTEYAKILQIPLPDGPALNATKYTPEEASEHIVLVDVAVNPTCTETGLTTGESCYLCKEMLVAQEVVPSLGHSFTNYVPNGDATCIEDGTKTAKCDRCDVTDTVIDTGSTIAHNYVEGKCTECGGVTEPEVVISADMNGDGVTSDADAYYLLRHVLFPTRFPVNQDADVNGDGAVIDSDAYYLLRYTLFPDRYPLYPKK